MSAAIWVAGGLAVLLCAFLAGLMPDPDRRDVEGRNSSLDG